MKDKASTKRATASRVAYLPRLQAELVKADEFCARYFLNLDKFAADAIRIAVQGCIDDECNLAYHLQHHRLLPTAQARSSLKGEPRLLSVMNDIAQFADNLQLTITITLSPNTLGTLAESAATTGETVEKIIEHVVNEADFEEYFPKRSANR